MTYKRNQIVTCNAKKNMCDAMCNMQIYFFGYVNINIGNHLTSILICISQNYLDNACLVAIAIE